MNKACEICKRFIRLSIQHYYAGHLTINAIHYVYVNNEIQNYSSAPLTGVYNEAMILKQCIKHLNTQLFIMFHKTLGSCLRG